MIIMRGTVAQKRCMNISAGSKAPIVFTRLILTAVTWSNHKRMEIKSPVSGTSNVRTDDVFDVQLIVNGYRDDLSFDVSAYYKGLEKLPLYKCLDTGYRFFYPPELTGNEMLYQHLEQYD